MLVTIDHVLTADELAKARTLLADAAWQSGLSTAGLQAAQAKKNEQLPDHAPQLPALRSMVMQALQGSGNPQVVNQLLDQKLDGP